MNVLKIKNLYVESEGKEILKGINLNLERGKTIALMGPNGSGKSTLVKAIMGHPKYKITKGEIKFNNKKINSLSPDKIAKLGIFLSFQHPREIEGIEVKTFLKQSFKSLNKEEISPIELNKKLENRRKFIGLDKEIMYRDLNRNFSGGEKKKLEILQVLLYNPKLILLDETDSGLDIDSLKAISNSINKIIDKKKTLLIITHYRRIFEYISPDKVIIMKEGKIIKQGGLELIHKIEKEGYKKINGK